MLEKLGWSGICIEANPDIFALLKNNRKCDCYNVALTDSDKEVEFLKINGSDNMLSGLIESRGECLQNNPQDSEVIKLQGRSFDTI